MTESLRPPPSSEVELQESVCRERFEASSSWFEKSPFLLLVVSIRTYRKNELTFQLGKVVFRGIPTGGDTFFQVSISELGGVLMTSSVHWYTVMVFLD